MLNADLNYLLNVRVFHGRGTRLVVARAGLHSPFFNAPQEYFSLKLNVEYVTITMLSLPQLQEACKIETSSIDRIAFSVSNQTYYASRHRSHNNFEVHAEQQQQNVVQFLNFMCNQTKVNIIMCQLFLIVLHAVKLLMASIRSFDLDPRLVLETRLLFKTQLLLKHCQPGIPG